MPYGLMFDQNRAVKPRRSSSDNFLVQHQLRQRGAQVVHGDEMPSHVPQRGLGLPVFAGRHDRADAHIRPQREQRQQQAALEDTARSMRS